MNIRLATLAASILLAAPAGAQQVGSGKRWRRDHEWGLPLCDPCHRALHAHGNEREWCNFDPVNEAAMLRLESIQEGIL